MRTLVDTNVLSEARHPKGDPRVRLSVQAIPEADLFLSVVTLGELVRGVAKLPDGKRRRELEDWVRDIEEHHADRILPIDMRVAHVWGELTASVPRTLPVADGLIAATALRYDLALMTRNTKDFTDTGVRLIDPCTEEQL